MLVCCIVLTVPFPTISPHLSPHLFPHLSPHLSPHFSQVGLATHNVSCGKRLCLPCPIQTTTMPCQVQTVLASMEVSAPWALIPTKTPMRCPRQKMRPSTNVRCMHWSPDITKDWPRRKSAQLGKIVVGPCIRA